MGDHRIASSSTDVSENEECPCATDGIRVSRSPIEGGVDLRDGWIVFVAKW